MKRPLIYYALSVYIACISLMFLQINIIFGILITITFAAVIFFTQNIKGFILTLCFFVIGCLSFFIYFNARIAINQQRDPYLFTYVRAVSHELLFRIQQIGQSAVIPGKNRWSFGKIVI